MKKIFLIGMGTVDIIYTLWYMHFGSVFTNSGALSKIGLIHPVLFAVWGIITYLTLSLNIVFAYKKYTQHKFYIFLLIISSVGMALTLLCDFDYDKKVEYILHCGGSLTFSVVMSLTIFVLYILCFNKSLYFKIVTLMSAVILITDLGCLLLFKETSLIESVPIIFGVITLTVANMLKEKNTVEIR